MDTTHNPITPWPGVQPLVTVVVIGRNEGARLTTCLQSVLAVPMPAGALEVLYVDSGSSDDSVARAQALGVMTSVVQPVRPSAATGRNAGWRQARGSYVLFLDGDTLLHPEFLPLALQAMERPDLAIVWGHRRESAPEQSVYVRVLDLDWVYPPGQTEFCGGDALVRRSVLQAVNGFDETLIAGEEPEMCRRIRARGHRILHLDAPMTRHDLAIRSFRPYWRRAFRAGHAYAEVSARFRDTSDPLWQSDARRNLVRGALLQLVPLLLALEWAAGASGLLWLALAGLTALVLLARTVRHCGWKSPDRRTLWLYALHSHLQQIPIFWGQLSQRWDAWRGVRRRLIEYKADGDGC